MKTAATVLASATTATALSQMKKMAVPQMPSGRPSTTARLITHNPVSRRRDPAAGQDHAAGPNDQQTYENDPVPEHGIDGRHEEGDFQAEDPKSFDRPACQQSFLSPPRWGGAGYPGWRVFWSAAIA